MKNQTVWGITVATMLLSWAALLALSPKVKELVSSLKWEVCEIHDGRWNIEAIPCDSDIQSLLASIESSDRS
jgi:hypothetical protein